MKGLKINKICKICQISKSACITLVTIFSLCTTAYSQQIIRVGAKHFNEGYILSEMLSQMLEDNGYKVERKFSLGGTKICFDALNNGDIDVYPEYTGTITEEIFKLDRPIQLNELNAKLKNELNLQISEPYGFNNTYAFVVSRETAEKLNLKKISDLKNHPEVRIAFTYEFMKRKDGWENLASVYNLTNNAVGIEHGLAYQALDDKKIDLTDAYSTDGEIVKYGLLTLEDDKGFFPKYFAVSFYRAALDDRIKQILDRLGSKISENEMQTMNSEVLYEKKSFAEVASKFLKSKGLLKSEKNDSVKTGYYSEILSKTLEHIKLTLMALLLAVIAAVPLGILLYIYSSASRPVLYIAGLMQTVPSIALLAIMIPIFGIGIIPAIAALFIYAILPILRNTASGLLSVDPLLKKVATGMGLSTWQKLRYVELPLASPAIFTGIKTAAVINIGTATLAAFIGAGGLGEFIVTGLALNNTSMILKGAIPAALLAIITEFVFELIEKLYLPKHLKQKAAE